VLVVPEAKLMIYWLRDRLKAVPWLSGCWRVLVGSTLL
jgi:hypothetical protein